MRVEEVAEELGVSIPYAYKLIRKMNEELKKTGCITIAGRIDRQFSMRSSTQQKIRPKGASNNVRIQNADSGTWYAMCWFTDWKGERKQKCKRGFATKKEAQA